MHPLASRVVRVTVKPGDTHLDLGKVSIPSLSLPKIGDEARDFSDRAAAREARPIWRRCGATTYSIAFRRWCGPCVTKPTLLVERPREEFAGDKPLVVVGANLDADRKRAGDFLTEKPLPWQHAPWATGSRPTCRNALRSPRCRLTSSSTRTGGSCALGDSGSD